MSGAIFIESHRDEGRLFIKFEDVNDPEHARKLVGPPFIWMKNHCLPIFGKRNILDLHCMH